MPLPRRVESELLDCLAEQDPAAQRSRRDLQRVHRVMGTRGILLKAWRAAMPAARADGQPFEVLELGAGDGSLLLGIARALPAGLPGSAPSVRLTLLDRQALLTPSLVADYAVRGWHAQAQIADVLDWAGSAPRIDVLPPAAPRWDLIVANLFLHHFKPDELTRLLGAIAARSDRLLACEPRRSRFALAGSHLIGALGVNAITREDAVSSVHAGFVGDELSTLWPAAASGWDLREHAAGVFSHCLLATRVPAAA